MPTGMTIPCFIVIDRAVVISAWVSCCLFDSMGMRRPRLVSKQLEACAFFVCRCTLRKIKHKQKMIYDQK